MNPTLLTSLIKEPLDNIYEHGETSEQTSEQAKEEIKYNAHSLPPLGSGTHQLFGRLGGHVKNLSLSEVEPDQQPKLTRSGQVDSRKLTRSKALAANEKEALNQFQEEYIKGLVGDGQKLKLKSRRHLSRIITPERIQKKIDDIDLEKAKQIGEMLTSPMPKKTSGKSEKQIDNFFYNYVKTAIELAKKGKIKNKETNMNGLDRSMLKLFIRLENKRNKNLNLDYIELDDLKGHINKKISESTNDKAKIKVICPISLDIDKILNGKNEENPSFEHYSFIIDTDKGKITGFTIIGRQRDDAHDRLATALRYKVTRDIKEDLIPLKGNKIEIDNKNFTFSYFSSNEKSLSCLVALKNSIKAEKEMPFFDRHIADTKSNKKPKLNLHQRILLAEQMGGSRRGVGPVSDLAVSPYLPRTFYKHIDSGEELNRIRDSHKTSVTKFDGEVYANTGLSETLQDRFIAYMANNEGKVDNRSLDGFRLQEIKRYIDSKNLSKGKEKV